MICLTKDTGNIHCTKRIEHPVLLNNRDFISTPICCLYHEKKTNKDILHHLASAIYSLISEVWRGVFRLTFLDAMNKKSGPCTLIPEYLYCTAYTTTGMIKSQVKQNQKLISQYLDRHPHVLGLPLQQCQQLWW